MTIGGFVPPPFVPIKLRLMCDDGEEYVLDYIQLEPSRGDVEKVVLTNRNQPVPWKIELTLNFLEGTFNFNYSVSLRGLTAVRELEAMRFTQALAIGGVLELIHLDTGFVFQKITITTGVISPVDPDLLKLVEKVALIQSKTRVPIVIPEASESEEEDTLSAQDVATVYETAQKLETGRAILDVANWETTADLELSKKLIDLFDQNEPVSLSFSFENETGKIFGYEVPLGMVLLTCERTIMLPEDLKSLKEAVANQSQDNYPVKFTPFEGSPMLAHYLDWLSPEDRGFIIRQLKEAAGNSGAIIPGIHETQ